jgi:hypothetical protein
MRRLSASILILLLCGCAALVSAIQLRELGWEDLVGTFEFEDPFEQLTSEQVYDLGTFVRVTKLKEADPASVTQSMEDEGREAEERLAAGGVDIDYLISIAPEVKKQRIKKATAVVPELNGQQVKLPGYLLPLEFEEKKVTEFLLVPWFGACIHTPPPPPNQIVFVTMEEGYGNTEQFAPVWVWGEMQVKKSQKSLFLVDGESGIDTGYTLVAEKVTPYKPDEDK